MTTLVHLVQAGLAALAFGLIRLIPIDVASAIGGRLGRAVGPRLARSHVARRNLARAFPEASAAEIEAIVGAMWENIGRTAGEYPHLARLDLLASGRVELVGDAHIARLRDGDEGGILFSGHLANWEVMGHCSAEVGVPLDLVYRAPNNPYMGWLFRARRSGDAELVPKGAAGAKRAMALLKAGHTLGMLVDQKMNDGIPVPFFGRAAMTAPALAQFALRFACPVLPARIERTGGAHFRLTVFPPLEFPDTGERTRDIETAMGRVNALLESWIRERPAEWLWLHRRWPEDG